MSSDHLAQSDLLERIGGFVAAAENDELTDDAWTAFDQLLCENDEACRLYAEYMEVSFFLPSIVEAMPASETLGVSVPESQSAPCAAPGLVANLLHGTVDYFSSGWPMAYLASTVICTIGILILASIPVSHPTQFPGSQTATRSVGQNGAIANATANTDPSRSAPVAGPSPLASSSSEFQPLIGQITGMVDCKWADDSTFAFDAAYVPLGRKYALSSGVMEITYDTGAKVILQGPCTYKVESRTGGYLSLGKLTAKVEKGPRPKAQGPGSAEVASGQWSVVSGRKSEIRNPKSKISSPQPLATSPSSNPSLSTLHSPLFTIKTPTAVVTDLGTEFGVEVSKGGSTTSHVFRGAVELQPIARKGQRVEAVRLGQNESACVERSGEVQSPVVRRIAADFVRHEQLPKLAEESRLKPLRRWQAYSRQLRKDPTLVAYYTFEPHKEGNAATLPNQSAVGSVLDGEIHNAEWVNGRFPGKFALYFHGAGSGDKVVLPEQQRFNFTQPFSVAVWFQSSRFSGQSVPSLIAKGGSTWRIERYGNDTNCLTIDSTGVDGMAYTLVPRTEVTDSRWHLAVAVIEPRENSHHKRLYLDGRLDGEIDLPAPMRQTDEPVWLGANNGCPDREFEGRMDEVMIFDRAVSVEEVTLMFNAGNPYNASAKETNNED